MVSRGNRATIGLPPADASNEEAIDGNERAHATANGRKAIDGQVTGRGTLVWCSKRHPKPKEDKLDKQETKNRAFRMHQFLGSKSESLTPFVS
jgi:hypothetical protein